MGAPAAAALEEVAGRYAAWLVTEATIIANTGSPVVRATDRGVANGSSYVYRVAAINESGLGPFSDPSAAIVPSAFTNKLPWCLSA